MFSKDGLGELGVETFALGEADGFALEGSRPLGEDSASFLVDFAAIVVEGSGQFEVSRGRGVRFIGKETVTEISRLTHGSGKFNSGSSWFRGLVIESVVRTDLGCSHLYIYYCETIIQD